MIYYIKSSIGNIAVPIAESQYLSQDFEFMASIPCSVSFQSPFEISSVDGDFYLIGKSGTRYLVEKITDSTGVAFRFNVSGSTPVILWSAISISDNNRYLGIPFLMEYNGKLTFVTQPTPFTYRQKNNNEYELTLSPPTSTRCGACLVKLLRSKTILSTLITSGSIYNAVLDIMEGGSYVMPTPDPYEEGGTSDEDLGGDGTFDDSSDQIVDSTLPTISAANTGFTRIYNPTLAQVQALANYLWTDQTIIQTLWNHVKQFLENPMDAFIAFNLVPCAVPDGGITEFKVMYIGTGVSMTAAASQFVDVDCGTLDIDEYYGSALDYAPNTKISVFLPFIGTVQLDTDDVMGKTIGIKYRIDIVSGGCVAKIIVDGSIHYQYSGHCAVNIPFTSADYTGYISAMLQAAKIGATIASAGAAAGAAALEEGVDIPGMAAAGASADEMLSASRAYDRKIANSAVEAATAATFNSLAPKNISNTVNTIMSSKPVVERSGSFSGNTGYLGIRRPFCIIERPRMCNPSEYGKYNGRPAMMTMFLGDCTGFTKVQQVQLTGIPATNPELDEIGAFLKGGVIL